MTAIRQLVLLPGLHGTTELFTPFSAAAPRDYSIQALPLPAAGSQDYAALAHAVIQRLPAGPIALIAESFSGPLAIQVAQRCPSVVGLVLCATFITPPLPSFLSAFVPAIARFVPPLALLRAVMTGGDRSTATALQAAIRATDRRTLLSRIDAALTVDASGALSQLRQPVLCLRATNDRLVSRASAARMRSVNSSVRVIDVAGPHLLLQTRPIETWPHIARFVDALAAPNPSRA